MILKKLNGILTNNYYSREVLIIQLEYLGILKCMINLLIWEY